VANGHIQAVGTDQAGRRQYRYHDEWRRQRDAAKHERVLLVAARLPQARERAAADLARSGYPRERVLSAAFHLLDLGWFRVGGEAYAEGEDASYGLATLLREHVVVRGDDIHFDFRAKSGKRQVKAIPHAELAGVLRGLKRRQDPSPELLAWKDRLGWHDLKSSDVNDYLRDAFGTDVTAKDFRTWHATVLMAVALSVSREVQDTPSKRKRAVARAYAEVAGHLGNTPAVVKASYVDPRVVDLYDDGITVLPAIEQAVHDGGSEVSLLHGPVERAVVEMISAAPVRRRRAA
jgi:DNA topoisomerase IB